MTADTARGGRPESNRATFVLVHGSWHTGETWYKVEKRLAAEGATVYSPTLTGMESLDEPGGEDVGLQTHIHDIAELFEQEDLSDVVLVGHSYAGFVITGVADLLPDRIQMLVYLDAFIPENGESLFDILGAKTEASMRGSLVDASGRSLAEGAETVWLLPPGDAASYLGSDADEADIAWLQERLVYKPVLTFAERLQMQRPERVRSILSAFIRCTGFPFLESQEAKAMELGWESYRVDTGHDAMLTRPAEVAELLQRVSEER